MIHNPRDFLIGVFTGNGPKYEARERLCRDTWVGELRKMGFPVKFVRSTDHPFPDQCEKYEAHYVTCESGWNALPQKTRAWCSSALQWTKWQWLAKVDDDCYIDPCRYANFLLSLTPDKRYVGGDVGTRQGLPPYASGGASYLIDRECAAIVSEKLTDKTGYEDLLVGRILREAGIPLHHDPRFIPFGMVQGFPQRGNYTITSHALDAETWMKAWENR